MFCGYFSKVMLIMRMKHAFYIPLTRFPLLTSVPFNQQVISIKYIANVAFINFPIL